MNPSTKKPVAKIDAEGNLVRCAKSMENEQCGYKAGAKVCGKCGALAVQAKSDEDPSEEKGAFNQGMSHVDDPMDDDFKKRRKMRHAKRMQSMGMKEDDTADDVFLCAASRQIKSASVGACSDCPGGCFSDGVMPDLLEIEAMTEDVLGVKIHASGYGSEAAQFVVQGRRKSDNQAIEAYWTDEGELDGWFRIPESELVTKSATISPDEAATKALEAMQEHLKGEQVEIISHGTGELDGRETTIIEVKDSQGRTYDVHVFASGDVAAIDEILTKGEEDADVEEKGMVSEEQRASMAEEGTALPDGSYPIANVDDLRNAIQAFGRAKDPAAAKAHIMKRARELNQMDLIPEDWKAEGKAFIDLALVELELLELEAAEETIERLLGLE